MVGMVKEKEEANREYRKAISEGHGAYLVDEEAPVSVSALQLSNSDDCMIPSFVHKIQNCYMFCPYVFPAWLNEAPYSNFDFELKAKIIMNQGQNF